VQKDLLREPLISVVIVNYRVPTLLRECLLSLRASEGVGVLEIVVVDNNSGDHSQAMVESEFPEVRWVGLKSNIGFGKACNVGARLARGANLLLLNPDTVVAKDTLRECVSFLQSHPRLGVLGPRILNSDGSLQVSCRRSFPTPLVAFYRFAGLSRLFPRSRTFGRYNLTYLDPDESAQVDAISGSFMLLPRKVYLEIGGFDEQFFMYGEDLDLCRRVHEAGYEVWYFAGAQIVHFGGRSSSQRSVRSRAHFYEAMLLFSRKYRHLREAFLPGWLVYLGIVVQAGLWTGSYLRFRLTDMPMPYGSGTSQQWLMLALHLLISDIFVFTFWYRGVYSRTRYSRMNALTSGLFASLLFTTSVYFVQSLAFSRIAFGASALVITLLLVAWRELLPRALGRMRQLIYATGSVVVLGEGTVARRLLLNVEKDRTARIRGVVWPSDQDAPAEVFGYPVLGTIGDLRRVLETNRADVLLIGTSVPWYSHVIEGLASHRVRSLSIRWVPREMLGLGDSELPETVPLHDFTL
jgi:O-antigen biosynthesis protein